MTSLHINVVLNQAMQRSPTLRSVIERSQDIDVFDGQERQTAVLIALCEKIDELEQRIFG